MSQVYDNKIGPWDKIAIRYGYTDFPSSTNERAALEAILEEGHKADLFYLSNQDADAHGREARPALAWPAGKQRPGAACSGRAASRSW